eukprot:scaffold30091_cov101-Isochrysis_galbana.AAC.3
MVPALGPDLQLNPYETVPTRASPVFFMFSYNPTMTVGARNMQRSKAQGSKTEEREEGDGRDTVRTELRVAGPRLYPRHPPPVLATRCPVLVRTPATVRPVYT